MMLYEANHLILDCKLVVLVELVQLSIVLEDKQMGLLCIYCLIISSRRWARMRSSTKVYFVLHVSLTNFVPLLACSAC